MTFTNGLKSPINGDAPFPFPVSTAAPAAPIRTVSSSSHFPTPNPQVGSTSSNNLSAATSTSPTDRGGVPRRFTTNALPTLNTLAASSAMSMSLSPIGQQRRQAAEPSLLSPSDYSSMTQSKARLLEQKREEFARLKASRDRYSTELEQSKQEMDKLESDLRRLSVPEAHSEPTTPPEYRDAPIPPIGSRPKHLSLASLGALGPIGNSRPIKPMHRSTLSGSHHSLGLFAPKDPPNQSFTITSRGNSDEEEDEYDQNMPTTSRRSV
jgi:hypothetical protein